MIRLRASGMSGSLCQKRGLQDTYDLSMSLSMSLDTYDLSMSFVSMSFANLSMSFSPLSEKGIARYL
jgi:hypothetical protein